MFVRLSLVVLFCMVAGVVSAQSQAPQAYACEFAEGTTHVYDKGAFNVEVPGPLSFGIAAIDEAAQTADLRTEAGTGSLKIVLAVNATHFIEVVTEGWLHITTIFEKDDAKGAYPAVHSRHFGLLGQPIVTQYQGFCQAQE